MGRGRGRPPVARVKVVCTGCTAELERYAWQVTQNRTGRYFCSTTCRDRVGSKPRRKAEVTCQRDGCGVAFYPRTGAPNLYCSRICTDLARRVGADRLCAYCGEAFHVRPSDPDTHCSRACYDLGRATPVGSTKPTPEGYVLEWQPGHSEAQATGWAFQHRVVMASVLGHPLPEGSTVHHRNGVRHDNRPRNLELRAGSHGPGQGVLDLLDWARELIATWEPDEPRLRELAELALVS